MTGSDQKFWIGIASAFILPTMAYVYTQGMTAQSIAQLATSVDKFQANVDTLSDRMNGIQRDTMSNTASLVAMGRHLDQVDTEMDKHGERIVIIETKMKVK